MSTTKPVETPATPSAQDRRSGQGRRRVVMAASVAGLLAVGGAATSLYLLNRDTIVPTAPIALPAAVPGLAAQDPTLDLTTTAAWKDKARSAVPGATVVGRTYAPGSGRLTVRVVAARADLTGKLDLAWPVDAGHEPKDGDGARCTQNVRLVPQGRAGVRPTVMICWRTTKDLSAYALAVDPTRTVTDADAMPALAAAWAGAGKAPAAANG